MPKQIVIRYCNAIAIPIEQAHLLEKIQFGDVDYVNGSYVFMPEQTDKGHEMFLADVNAYQKVQDARSKPGDKVEVKVPE